MQKGSITAFVGISFDYSGCWYEGDTPDIKVDFANVYPSRSVMKRINHKMYSSDRILELRIEDGKITSTNLVY